MTVPVCYYGSSEPLPARRELRAGPLTAVYEAGDLRYVRYGDHEVCRRWYAAVRDANWGTVPGVITDEVIETTDGFRVRYTSTHRRGDIHFVWHAEIVGSSDGTLSFTFDGEAKSTFRRNRIGFCILHPIKECAGAAVRLRHPGGTHTDTHFPKLIAPQNPFKEIVGLSHDLAPGVRAEWAFGGDVFETEDQRNWTDASFKTFCTPLRLPFPVEVPAGTRIRQTVALTVRGTVPAEVRSDTRPTFAIGTEAKCLLPEIGFCMPSHGERVCDKEVIPFVLLAPGYLRAEVDTTIGNCRRQLAPYIDYGFWKDIELSLTVLDAADVTVTARLWREVCPKYLTIRRILLHQKGQWSTPGRRRGSSGNFSRRHYHTYPCTSAPRRTSPS